jgi:cytoskeletal protein RodZ
MPETIGARLKSARETRRLTIEKAEEVTRVRAVFLRALEADDWPALPSAAQGRGFLRLYADYLGLDVESLLEEQRNGTTMPVESVTKIEAGAASQPEPEPDPEPLPDPERSEPNQQPAPVLDESPAPPTNFGTRFNLPFRFPWARQAQGQADDNGEQAEGPGEEPLENAEAEELPLEEEPVESPTHLQSQLIFKSIGAQLRERRESLSLTLEEIERHTHVRAHNLKVLEAGAFERLSSPVQARGMISNYAAFLDLDADALLLRFAEGLQAQRIERNPLAELTRPRGHRWHLPLWARRILSIDLIFGVGMAVGLAAFSIWGLNRVLEAQSAPSPEPTGPSISDVLLATPGSTLEAALVTFTPTLPITPTQPTLAPDQPTPTIEVTETLSTAPVQLVLVIADRAFLRVIVDGEVKFEGRVVAGGALNFDANEQIEVITGNGAAIEVIFNQSRLGLMGAYGEVVNRIYTVRGVFFPTPTEPPTATITPRFTITPTITITPSITPSPIFTPTPTPQPQD